MLRRDRFLFRGAYVVAGGDRFGAVRVQEGKASGICCFLFVPAETYGRGALRQELSDLDYLFFQGQAGLSMCPYFGRSI